MHPKTIARPPEVPEASTKIAWLPEHAFAMVLSRAVELHLVSCRKKMWGFSCWIMLFISLYFPGLLSPWIFHEMRFMMGYWEGCCSTSWSWNIFPIPPTFPQCRWFVGDLFSFLSLHSPLWAHPSYLSILYSDRRVSFPRFVGQTPSRFRWCDQSLAIV